VSTRENPQPNATERDLFFKHSDQVQLLDIVEQLLESQQHIALLNAIICKHESILRAFSSYLAKPRAPSDADYKAEGHVFEWLVEKLAYVGKWLNPIPLNIEEQSQSNCGIGELIVEDTCSEEATPKNAGCTMDAHDALALSDLVEALSLLVRQARISIENATSLIDSYFETKDSLVRFVHDCWIDINPSQINTKS
jgi:hypothetical protein